MREIQWGADRPRTQTATTDTRHSFSYGAHYDPDNVGFGPVVAINVETIAPGAGYDLHQHADVDIVTWVIDGTLRHRDSTGAGGEIEPGTVQWLRAGAGVQHEERNASSTEPLTFVQTMIASQYDGEPEYGTLVLGPGLDRGHAIRAARLGSAQLLVVCPGPGEGDVTIPVAARRLVHVTRGQIAVGGDELSVGDELRTDEPGILTLTAEEPAEALVWLLS